MDKKLWLWQNGDHFWAFEHLYPKVSPQGDPCTLGEPVGYALLKKSYSSDPREPDAVPSPEGGPTGLHALLDEFDDAAQDHGWSADQGSSTRAAKAKARYDSAKEALRAALAAQPQAAPSAADIRCAACDKPAVTSGGMFPTCHCGGKAFNGTVAYASPSPAEGDPNGPTVEAWHGDRKVTIYPHSTVLCMQYDGTATEFVSDAPHTLDSVQAAFDWLYRATPDSPAQPKGMRIGVAYSKSGEAFEYDASDEAPVATHAGGWQPAETCESGGATILVKNDRGQVCPMSRGVIHNNPGHNDWDYGSTITGWMHLPAADDVQSPAPALEPGWRLVLVNEAFDDLMYWLDRCDDKGHLENCYDLVDPWSRFDYRHAPSPAVKAEVPPILEWHPGSNLFKDWCAVWFGPDSDDTYLARAIGAFPAQFHPTLSGARYTHATKGGSYALLGWASLQTDAPLEDMAEVVVYRGDDGRLWARAAAEFGARFTAVPKPSVQPTGGE